MRRRSLSIAAVLCLASCGDSPPRQTVHAPPSEIPELLRKLDSNLPGEREEATLRLTELGDTLEAALRKEADSAQGEVRFRLEQILASPYRGLDRKTAQDTAAIVKKCEELLGALTSVTNKGRHGSYHEIDEARERELRALLAKIPRFRGGSKLILRTIDEVYLRYHENGYHGWIWHWPYLDCRKAVELAERLQNEYPQSEEESLWTKIYCYRIDGLKANGDVDDRDVKNFASIEAQVRWKADPDRARALCRELLERYPRGKYAERASELLEQKDLHITLPSSWGQQFPRMDRR